ncbi:APC family permease [Alicyclobacillus sp. ALC3]|uniref:APC family permease n=1 Tax=Alicyclobacillus sp. ALC3 TaxID=2796143 RepID=UPI002378C019|nr:APC family permease [Alicyclobacillus sp. ALC3]WDL96015.1 amino acid permease [Alicyclobacillus sp. ALC3]
MEENLKRVLRTPEVLFIGINGVIGGGIFLLPGQVADLAGDQSLFAYLLAGVIAILIGLSFSEASSMFTKTGGSFVYAERAMGKTVAFTVGWMSWITFVIGWASLSNGLVSYLSALAPGVTPYKDVIIVVLVGLLCLLNTFGVRRGALTVVFFSIVKLIPLALLIVIGLFFVTHDAAQAGTLGTPKNFGQAVLVLIFAYGGFEMATIPQGEMVKPRKSVAIGVIGTLVGVTLLYMLIQVAVQRLDPALASSSAPLADAGRAMFAGGATVMTAGAALSIFGTKSGIALSSPRIVYALSFNRSLPVVFAKIWPRFQTPVVAIWTTGILVMILASTGTFQHLVLLNVAARLYEYLLVCIAVIVLRFRAKEANRPFKLPLGITIPAVASALCVWLLCQETGNQLLAALIALVLGLILYGIGRATQQNAA